MVDPNLEDHPTPPFLKRDAALVRPRTIVERLLARRVLLFVLVALGLVVVAASVVLLLTLARGAPPSATPTLAPTPASIKLPPSMDELTQQFPELADLLNDPALGSVYKEFIVAYQTGGAEAAKELAQTRGLLNDRGEIRITLVLESAEYVQAISQELQAAGITVEGSFREQVNIGVPLALIEQLAEQQGTQALFQRLTQMEHIVRLELPIPNRINGVSRIEGEGVAIIGADKWHAAGFTGQGVRIGVLDLGFGGYTDLLGTELPEQVTAKSFVLGEEPEQSSEVHGTACAEIVHETAPDAELYLAYYDGTFVGEGQAVDWLLEQNVHIITHSAGSALGPMDGTGEDAELVDEVVAKGVLWVNAAGNEAQNHYRGQFTDTDGDGIHEFPDGEEWLAIWPYSSGLMIILNWDDWQSVTEDYELYLSDSQGNPVASAEDTQDGSSGQMSAEGLILNSLSDSVYYVSIKAFKTTRPATFDLYVMGSEIEFPVPDHSLNTPSDARGALTVGATEYRDDSLASYSSQGPSNDGRLKPEVSAPAGVSGATYGPDAFDGTSAATPYVAGAAALVWSAFPDFSRDQVVAYLETNVLDLGPGGPDNGYGYGRVQLPAAADAAGAPMPTALPTLPLATQVAEPSPVAAATVGAQPSPVGPGPVEIGAPGAGPTAVPLALIAGMGVVGLCGAGIALGGVVLLLVAWRRSGATAAPVQPPLPPLPEFAPPPSGGAGGGVAYGTLEGPGLAPVHLKAGQMTIGRGEDADIVLRSSQVSRHHARIQCADGTCTVEDLRSSNGTFVNGKPVARAVLAAGDRLRVGDVELTYGRGPAPGASEAQGQAWLEFGGVRYPVLAAGLTIGRSSDNALHLADPLISRHHARIESRGGQFEVADLGSSNGTFVNERRIRQQVLGDGDELRVGESRFRFRVQRVN